MKGIYGSFMDVIEGERMEATFQEILRTREHDPKYECLISKYNELKETSVEALQKYGDAKTSFQMGEEAGVIENRILELYEEETDPFNNGSV